MIRHIQFAVLAIALLATPVGAFAQGTDGFYRAKQISMIIYSNAGEAYDIYARLLIRYMGDYIPGKPTFVPRNMTGAGGLKATEYLYKIAPKDGTEFGTIGRGLPIEPLLGGPGADFDPLQFTWIGSMNKEVSVTAAWYTAEVKTARDLLTKELIVGGTGGLSDSQLIPTALNALLGTKYKVVSGYNGSTAAMLAVERGELQGMGYHSWSNLKATKPEWFEQHKVNVLLQTSAGDKHPDLPDVPLVSELATTDGQRDALKLLFARELFGRPFLAPPAVPADRAKILRAAFDATVKDKRLLEEADKAQMEINAASGEELVTLLRQLYALPASVVDDAKKALGR